MVSVRNKKGQLTLTFNWVYVLIAGAVILLFFIGVIVKQKSISEEKLSYDISRTLESIITAATVSEKTLNKIDTSGLTDYTIFFNCEIEGGGFRDIFSGYGIEGTSATVETPIEAVFAPEEIQTAEIIAWSLPYNFPFKVMDLLMITSINTKYYVIADDSANFKEELENATSDSLNIEFVDVSDYANLKAGNNFHVRIIDFDESSNEVSDGKAVPEDFKGLDDSQVSAVSFRDVKTAIYHEKRGNVFKETGQVVITSLPSVERNAAKFALIFAGSEDDYKCNMVKAFKRLQILAEVYEEKYNELVDYYAVVEPTGNCATLLSTNHFPLFIVAATQCAEGGYEGCPYETLENSAQDIKNLNNNLGEGCIGIY